MEDIAREMIDEIVSSDRSISEKLRMFFWIQKYLWKTIEGLMDMEG